ncbi:MAG: DPP IV N-terminal domain-containing protein, partial [Gemmataceae bacterium]
REIILVDASAGTRQPAFDHAKVASALSSATGKRFDAERLPMEEVQFSSDGDEMRFRIEGKRWTLNRSSHRLAPTPSAEEKPKKEVGLLQRWRPGRGARVASADDRWVVNFRDHNVVLHDQKNNKDTILTRDGKEKDGYGGEVFWSPDNKKFIVFRTRRVQHRQIHLIESSPANEVQPRLHTLHYDKPGDPIDVRLPHLFDAESGREIALAGDLFASPWSIDHVRWEKDSSRFTFLYNQRGHQVLRLLAVDAATGKVTSLVDESSGTFIDYAHKFYLHWLEESREFLWMSERDGWNHLYLMDASTGKVKRQLTRGSWVVRSIEKIDPKQRVLWLRVSGLYPDQDPYHLHFVKVSLDDGTLVKLTGGDGTHQVSFSPDRSFLVDTYSRVDLAPITEVRRASDGKLVVELEKADLTELKAGGWKAPERVVAKGRDGTTDIWGVIFRPTNHDPNRKYPVIENIYAGPQGSFTPKSFREVHSHQALAELGFIVVQMDGMGTSHRSKAFHDVCWKNLGDSGFPDRIRWIQAAGKKDSSMDLSRVGIFGGSAGGQSSTRALLAHGDFYKVGVSDCGCHDNRVDKIWWNELWMGYPIGPHYASQSNANLENAKKLSGKLLLVVGEMDRNVDPASTMQVVNALVKADKDFELLIIPGAGHGAAESPYGNRRRQDFFVRHLLGVEPRHNDSGNPSLPSSRKSHP